jgi:outer membrane protein assembly factor BamB
MLARVRLYASFRSNSVAGESDGDVKSRPLSLLVTVVWLASFCLLRQHATAAPGEEKWRVTMAASPVACPAIGTNGYVYVTTEGFGVRPSVIQALDSASGELRWETNLTGGFYLNHPVIGPDGTVYVGELNGVLALDGNTGAQKWRAEIQLYYPSIVVGWNGVVFSEGGSVYALDPLNGAQKWRFYREGVRGPVTLAANDVLYLGTYDGKLLAVDAVTGRKIWEFLGSESMSFYTPSLGPDGTVYAPASDGNVYVFDGLTGQSNLVLSVEGGWNTYPVIGPDGAVYLGSPAGLLSAFDGTSGELKWTQQLGNSSVATPALAADGTLYVPTGNRLYALNSLTRATNWFFEESSGSPILPPNIGPDGTIYFGVWGENAVYALYGSSPLADSAWPKFQQNAANSGQWQSKGPTRITRQPRAQWAALDSTTQFQFYSPAARPFSVQWRLNGQSIAGETNEVLQIEQVRFADAGAYSVVISNEYGVATSDDAILSVGYSLAVTVVGPGEVTRDVELAVYPTNAAVQLTAVPRADRNFLGWSGALLSADTNLMLIVRSNVQLTATFEYLRGDVKWSFPFDDAPALNRDGILYAFSFGAVVAVDTKTGERLWRNGYFDSWWAPPAIGPDGTVYIGNYSGSSVIMHDGLTGEQKGGFNVGLCVHACPTIGVDGTLYLAGLKIYSYDPETRQLRWSFQGGDIFEGSPSLSSDGVLFAGCYDGKMYALNSANGAKVWEFATGGLIKSSPAIGADGTIYFGSADGKIYAVDGNTGQKRWDFATGAPVLGSAVIDAAGDIYIIGESGFYAVHGQTGEKKWSVTGSSGGKSFPVPEYTDSAALAADGTLYFGGTAVNSRNGEVLWSAGNMSGGRAPTIGPDGTLYVGGSAIYATSLLADSPWPKFHRDRENTGRAPARPIIDVRRSRMTAAGFEVVVHSELGERLQVEWTGNLRDWHVLNVLTNATGTGRLVDLNAGTEGSRFYRTRKIE